MALRLPRFRRFSTQLLLLLAGFLALVQILVYVFVARANESNALNHIGQNLRGGATIFRQYLTERVEYLTGIAKVLSDDYGMRQLIIQEPIDRDTLRSTLRSYGARLQFNEEAPR
ncbi:MAG TPA: hypothetical protein VHN79_14195, partial [Lacunisphaera sp.]|nr:hypothetical protein [Lacunisphaera sp.]